MQNLLFSSFRVTGLQKEYRGSWSCWSDCDGLSISLLSFYHIVWMVSVSRFHQGGGSRDLLITLLCWSLLLHSFLLWSVELSTWNGDGNHIKKPSASTRYICGSPQLIWSEWSFGSIRFFLSFFLLQDFFMQLLSILVLHLANNHHHPKSLSTRSSWMYAVCRSQHIC